MKKSSKPKRQSNWNKHYTSKWCGKCKCGGRLIQKGANHAWCTRCKSTVKIEVSSGV